MTTDGQKKAAQRKRRAAGFEYSQALVNMPDFVRWLVWDGRLDAADAEDKDAITKAHEDFLREHYALEGMASHDPPPQFATLVDELAALRDRPQFAAGSFGAEFTTLRDRPQYDFGLMQREGVCWNWRDPQKVYLITRRNADLRRAADSIPEPDLRREEDQIPVNGPPSQSIRSEDWPHDPHYVAWTDDYDPETDLDENRDLIEADHELLFDEEGFESE